jgi:hypothetical protein
MGRALMIFVLLVLVGSLVAGGDAVGGVKSAAVAVFCEGPCLRNADGSQ